MKSLHLAVLTVLAAFTGLASAHAQSLTQATVTAVSGSATVTLPGSSQQVPVTPGMLLPEGATIATGAEAEVLVETHEGIQAGFSANTTASLATMNVDAQGVRNVIVDLKAGSVVSNLDPSKRALNNYGVRTPKGVAAARGTTYSATVAGGRVVVNTVTGGVSFFVQNSAGVEVEISVTGGQVADGTSDTAISLADALSDPSFDQAVLAQAVTSTVTVAAIIVQAAPAGSPAAAAATAVLSNAVQQVTSAAVASGNTALLSQAVATASSYAPAAAATMTAAVASAAGTNTQLSNTVAAASSAAAAAPRATVTTTTNAQGQTQIQVTPSTQSQSPNQQTTTPPLDIPVDNIIVSPSS